MAANKPWWASLESSLYTKFKTKLNNSLSSTFPNLKCTASPMTVSASKFPTVYFHAVDWVESGNDLENTDTNAVLFTLQVDVITNTSLDDCKDVIYESINIMKSYRFSIIAMPVYSANNNLYTGVVRFRRYIGGGETI